MSKEERSDVAILLFKWNDLRLHDHLPLAAAHSLHREVLHLFVVDPFWFGKTRIFGFKRTGHHRAKFLLQSLADLRRNLKDKGSNLIIRVGNSADVVERVVAATGASQVYCHEEVCSEEMDIEKSIQARVPGLRWRRFWGNTLLHPEDLPFDIKRIPDTFTQFRRDVESKAKIRDPVIIETMKPCPIPADGTSIPPAFPFSSLLAECCNIGEGLLPTLEVLGAEPIDTCLDGRASTRARTSYDTDESVWGLSSRWEPDCTHFLGGETAALKRLRHYVWDTHSVTSYKDTRNGLLGQNYSTKLSPWLAFGCISPRLVYQEIKRFEKTMTANDSTYWVIFELLWRDFFKLSAVKWGPRLFFLHGPRRGGSARHWNTDMDLLHAWSQGKTGYPFVDANMRELLATGFMSNRGRQNVASFLVNDLALDWRLGAEWFEGLLIDHDPCSNYGNWNYVAGVGADPRTNRYFLIPKQSRDYDKSGTFMKRWLPELSTVPVEQLHDPSRMLPVVRGAYPAPVVRLLADREKWASTKAASGDAKEHRHPQAAIVSSVTNSIDIEPSGAGAGVVKPMTRSGPPKTSRVYHIRHR